MAIISYFYYIYIIHILNFLCSKIMITSILDKAKQLIELRDYATALAILKPLKQDQSIQNDSSILSYLYKLWSILFKVCKKKSVISANLISEIITQQAEVFSISFNPNSNEIISCSKDGSIFLFDFESKKFINDFKTDHEPILSSALVQSHGLITSHTDGSIKYWDLSSGKLIRIYKKHTKDVKSVAVRFDGKYFVSGGLDKAVHIWNTESAEIIRSITNIKGLVLSVDYSYDGNFVVIGCSDSRAVCIDVSSLEVIADIEYHDSSVRCCVISPNCKLLALGSDDRKISVWNFEDFSNKYVFRGHSWDISALTFTPDGGFLASAGRDRNIYIWNLENSNNFIKLEGHAGNITCLKFIKGGRYLISSSEDKTIRIWKVEYDLEYNEDIVKNWKDESKIYFENFLKRTNKLIEIKYNTFVRSDCSNNDESIKDEDLDALYKELCERSYGFIDKNEIRSYLLYLLEQYECKNNGKWFKWY